MVAWVIVFTLAFGELGASVLVTPPGESTLPIRIYTLIANAPPSQVAALALLQVAVIFCPLAVIGLGLAANDAHEGAPPPTASASRNAMGAGRSSRICPSMLPQARASRCLGQAEAAKQRFFG